MAARRKPAVTESVSPNDLSEQKAAEFKLLASKGWRMAWLVVSSVEHGGSGGRPKKTGSQEPVSGKVSMNKFAEMIGRGRKTIQMYYRAWELAYDDGTAPCSAANVPTDVEWVDGKIQPPDEFCLEDDDLGHSWDYYYEWAQTGKRPKSDDLQDDSDDEEESAPPQLSVVEDEDDETDSVDEDFGLPEEDSDSEPTEDERAEIDKESQSDAFQEVLDSLEAISEKVVNFSDLSDANEELLDKIACAAEQLAATARAFKKAQPAA